MTSNSDKMNIFLQRMLRNASGEEKECERPSNSSSSSSESRETYETSPKPKTNWMKRLGTYSPSKSLKDDSSNSAKSTSPKYHNSFYHRRSVPVSTPKKESSARALTSSSEMQCLEDIIRDFENGFKSPTKKQLTGVKSNNFVKKIVAAFESKYKTNDGCKKEQVDDNGKDKMQASSQGLSSGKRFSFESPKIVKKNVSEIPSEMEGKDKENMENLEEENECLIVELSVAGCSHYDDNVNNNNVNNNDDSVRNHYESPRVVGAFLKKPIEVDDTTIDWIPITGNRKLPRKKSLKKIFSMFTGKKSDNEKSQILYLSQRNLNENGKEYQDSGYDEKSPSETSSLTSFNETLLQQENCYVEEPERKVMRTFHPKAPLDKVAEHQGDNAPKNKKPLTLIEVPREEIKLDLGPSFPEELYSPTMSPVRKAPKKMPRNSLAPLPKHPMASKIPKHPFVSLTKVEEDQDSDELSLCSTSSSPPEEAPDSDEEDTDPPKYLSKNSSISSIKSEDYTIYDVPRKYLSEPELQGAFGISNGIHHIYDIPTTRSSTRPRSSVYEDALSLKRRSTFARSLDGISKISCRCPTSPDFYSSWNEEEPYYATVKPRNMKIYVSTDMLRSTSELSVNSVWSL